MKRYVYDLAHARAGDKGDVCNIGIIARRPEYYDVLVELLTAERIKELFGPWCVGEVTRYELANLGALNFVLRGALGGGALVSLRLDPQGKSYGYAVLRMEIDVPDILEVESLVR